MNLSFRRNLFCKTFMQGMSASLCMDRKVIITSSFRWAISSAAICFSIAEMLVGQVMALLRMDPSYLKATGRILVEHILPTWRCYWSSAAG